MSKKNLLIYAVMSSFLLFNGCSEEIATGTATTLSESQKQEATADLIKTASIVTQLSIENPSDNKGTSTQTRSFEDSFDYYLLDDYSVVTKYGGEDFSLVDTTTWYDESFQNKVNMETATYDAVQYLQSHYILTTPLYVSDMNSKTIQNTQSLSTYAEYTGNVTYKEENFVLHFPKCVVEMDENGISIEYSFSFMDGKYSVYAPVLITMDEIWEEPDSSDVFFSADITNQDGIKVGTCTLLQSEEIFFYDLEGNEL